MRRYSNRGGALDEPDVDRPAALKFAESPQKE